MDTQTSPDFRSSVVLKTKNLQLKDPLLLMGLPGIGFVSKLAADHLVKALEAERFATLYSPHFPNQVIALKSGRLRPFSFRFYHKRLKKRDLVILRGDIQPLTVEGQYEVSAKVLDFFTKLSGREAIAMAGYALNKKIEKPAIYVASTNKLLLDKFLKLGAKVNELPVPIVGMAGLVPGIASLYKVNGACLLVETPGTVIDAAGANELIDMISRYLGERIDATNLAVRAKKAQKLMERIEAQAKREEEKAGGIAGDFIRKDLSYIR
ncbi:PAC2 family protein [Candidatus Micrarchaeota archaeon]|nr:PAC2 family protein [Candidatus Micrarchaeota archaeon]